MEDSLSSDDDLKAGKQSASPGKLLDGESSLTQEDSERAEQNRIVTEKRIQQIIKTLRADGREFLAESGEFDVSKLPISKLVKKLG